MAIATSSFSITPQITIGQGQKLLFIAGPCQIESLDHALRVATFLKQKTDHLPIHLIYKSSYDKANRTSIKGARGIGLDAGLRILEEVRQQTGLPILTDIHSPEEARTAATVVDVIQTPAFLCRQTELLIAAGETGKTVNVKKGQFLHPSDMKFVAEKIASSGNHKILLCERGASFGYRDLIVDPRSFVLLREVGYPVIFDATHSVQSLGGAHGQSGGDRRFVQPLARAAVAVGVDGVFIECHNDPVAAPSDGPSMLPLAAVPALVEELTRLHAVVTASNIQ